MKTYFIKLIYIVTIFSLTACVYSNNSESKDGNASLDLDIKISKNGIIKNVFDESDYVKIWFFNKSNEAKSYLVKTKDMDSLNSKNNDYLAEHYIAQDSNLMIINTVMDVEKEEHISLKNIPADSEYMLIGIPGKDPGESIATQFIPLGRGAIQPSEKTNLYGKQYKNMEIEWNTDLVEGERLRFGEVILGPKENKILKIQAIPSMLGKEELESLYITGPFNGWDAVFKNYQMLKNEIGVYTIELEKTEALKFEYKFLYDNNTIKDCTADILDTQRSKLTANYINPSKYSPLISIINPKKQKGLSKSAISLYPNEDPNYDKDWENKGTLKIGVNTDKYMSADISMQELIDLRNEINSSNEALVDYEYEIWTAKNNNIKEVLITYKGKIDNSGTYFASSDNIFGDTYIYNEKIEKFVVKKRAIDGYSNSESYVIEEMCYVLENIDLPNEAGKYLFSVTAIDKENGYYEEDVEIVLID